MRAAIARWVQENFDDLLQLDLKIARLLGAPAPHTLSSWAYKNPFWRLIIDKIVFWLFNETDHCKNNYERIMNGLQGTIGGSNQTK